MDLDKARIAGFARQARSVYERSNQLVKDAQSKLYPYNHLNDAQRIFVATVATQARLTAHSAMEQVGLHALCDIESCDKLFQDNDFGPAVESYMRQASRFIATHPELLLSARMNICQLYMRTASDLLNRAHGVLEGKESISGQQIGRSGLWDK
ncbi:hypothetical protein KA183_04960 [bacterium]|nr:hypothetical protein [bacterium]QQR56193.1 MAG: hypothetical protein IPG59_14400 [Candidatus Melainabacteria bacterium]